MKAVILLALVACACAGFSGDARFEALATAQSNFLPQLRHAVKLTQSLTKLKPQVALPFAVAATPVERNLQLQDVSQACSVAVANLAAALVTGACASVPTPSSSQAALDTFCSSTCIGGITTAEAAVYTACTGDSATIFGNGTIAAMVRQAGLMTSFGCAKEGTTYCLPSLNQFNTSGMDEAGLNQICSPCMTKIIKAAAFAGSDYAALAQAAAGLDLVCTKREGRYCQLVLVELAPQFESDEPNLAALCHPCLAVMFAKAAQITAMYGDETETATLVALAPMLKAMCTKDFDGTPCIQKMQAIQQMDLSDTCPEVTSPTTECSATCKSAIVSVNSQIGCCFSVMLDMMATFMPEAPSYKDWVNNQCSLTMTSCGGVIVNAAFVVQNIRWEYVNNNRDVFIAKLVLDLATYFELDPESIRIVELTQYAAPVALSLSAVTGGVNVRYTVTPPDVTRGAAIKSQILTATIPLPSTTASLPLSARVDPSVGITVSEDEGTREAEEEYTGSATAGVASHAMVAACAAMALMAVRA